MDLTSIPSTSTDGQTPASPTSQQVLQDVQTLRKKGLGHLIPRYLERNGLSGADLLEMERPPQSSWQRNVGLGARGLASGVEAIGRAPGNILQGGAEYVGGKFGLPPEQMDNAVRMALFAAGAPGLLFQPGAPDATANRLGLPQPQTPGENKLVQTATGVGSAIPFAAGGGPLVAATTLLSGGAGGYAGEAVKQQGKGPVEQMVASLVAQLGTAGLITGMAGGIRRMLAGTAEARKAAQATQTVLTAATGQPGTLGQVNPGGKGAGYAQEAEAALRRTPAVASQFRDITPRQQEGLQSTMKGVVDQLAPVDQAQPELAGETAQLGIQGPRAPGVLSSQEQIQGILAHQAEIDATRAKVADLTQQRDALVASMDPAANPPKSMRDALEAFNAKISAAQSDEAVLARKNQEMFPGVTDKLAERYPTPADAAAVSAKKATERQVGDLNQQIDQMQAGLPRPNATPILGRTKVTEGFIPKFWNESQQLYDRAFQYVPPETPVFPSNTDAWVKLQNQALDNGLIPSATANPKIAQIAQDLHDALVASPEGVPFAKLKESKTAIDKMIKAFDPASTAGGPNELEDLLSLRGAIANDMAGKVVLQGGTEGAAAWKAAQDHFASHIQQIQDIFKPLVVKNTPEKVFAALMSNSRQGATVLQTTMNALEPEQRRIVLSSVLRKMMQGADGREFDPATFARNWRTRTPMTRAALTQHLGVEGTNNLNNVAKAIDILEATAKVLPEPAAAGSGGAFKSIINMLGGGGIVYGLSKGSPLSALGSAVGTGLVNQSPRAVSWIFTSPRVVRWLLGTTKIPMGVLPSALVQLSRQSQTWPSADRDAARSLIDQLGGLPLSARIPMQATDMTAVR